MSADRDVTRIVRSWLEEGATALPDRVLDTVLDQLPATPQRRAPWPVWRFGTLNTSMRLAITAAAVVAVVAVLGMMFWPRSGGVAGPGPMPSPSPAPSPSATASPTPSATPQRLADSPLQAGVVVATGLGQSQSISATFMVPEGWKGFAGSCVLPPAGTGAPAGMGICFLEVNTGLFSDPCHGTSGPADVPVGPTVNDLAVALGAQTAYTATRPTDVTLGGYSGKQMDLQMPSDVASCDGGEFTPWSGSIYAQGPDNHWRLWILDVEGDRLIIVATYFAATSEGDRAEQQAIVDSIQIEP
jgi:hypothetical protein